MGSDLMQNLFQLFKKIHNDINNTIVKFNPLKRVRIINVITHLLILGIIISLVDYSLQEFFGIEMIFFTPLIFYSYFLTLTSIRIYRERTDNYKKNKNGSALGKASFSSAREIKHLNKEQGIYFGKIGQKEVVKSPQMDGHVFVIGGSGLGKTQGVILPTLDRWNGSVLAIDIKGELSQNTKRRRRKFNDKVFVFDPENGNHPYNPIDFADTIPKIKDLSRALIPISKSTNEPFFKQTAQAILSAYIYDANKNNKTLGEIAETICLNPTSDIIEFCKTHQDKKVKMLASSIYDLGDKALGSVMSELKNYLLPYATDDKIQQATSRTDWSYKDLENNSTVYIKVSEYLIEQYRSLWSVIISQIMRELSKREENNNKPILLAIDELYRIGKLPNLINALSTLRSKNVHILGVIQSLAQLDDLYGKDKRKIILDNASFKFVLGADEVETQEYFSKLGGKQTIEVKSKSTNYGKNSNGILHSILIGADTITKSKRSEYLIRPEEWNKLEKPILFSPKAQPTQVELMPFWREF
jgi:type IV secretion system protein VirD4